MTDPLPADRLAELRRMLADETWELPAKQDWAALIGEIDRLQYRLTNPCDGDNCEGGGAAHCHGCAESDANASRARAERAEAEVARLTAENEQLADFDALGRRGAALQAERDQAVQRWHEQHKRAETAEGERDRLWMLLEIERGLTSTARLHAEALKAVTTFQLQADGETAARLNADGLVDGLLRALGPQRPRDDAHPGPQRAAGASVMDFPPEAVSGPLRAPEGFELYRCPTMCDTDCDAPCHESHEVGWKQRHDVEECGKRVALGYLLPQVPAENAEPRLYANGPPCRHDHTLLAQTETGWVCMVCGPAQGAESIPVLIRRRTPTERLAYLASRRDGAIARGLPPELIDDMIADAQAEITPEGEGIASADVMAHAAADQRAYCPDCGLPETNCACG